MADKPVESQPKISLQKKESSASPARNPSLRVTITSEGLAKGNAAVPGSSEEDTLQTQMSLKSLGRLHQPAAAANIHKQGCQREVCSASNSRSLASESVSTDRLAPDAEAAPGLGHSPAFEPDCKPIAESSARGAGILPDSSDEIFFSNKSPKCAGLLSANDSTHHKPSVEAQPRQIDRSIPDTSQGVQRSNESPQKATLNTENQLPEGHEVQQSQTLQNATGLLSHRDGSSNLRLSSLPEKLVDHSNGEDPIDSKGHGSSPCDRGHSSANQPSTKHSSELFANSLDQPPEPDVSTSILSQISQRSPSPARQRLEHGRHLGSSSLASEVKVSGDRDSTPLLSPDWPLLNEEGLQASSGFLNRTGRQNFSHQSDSESPGGASALETSSGSLSAESPQGGDAQRPNEDNGNATTCQPSRSSTPNFKFGLVAVEESVEESGISRHILQPHDSGAIATPQDKAQDRGDTARFEPVESQDYAAEPEPSKGQEDRNSTDCSIHEGTAKLTTVPLGIERAPSLLVAQNATVEPNEELKSISKASLLVPDPGRSSQDQPGSQHGLDVSEGHEGKNNDAASGQLGAVATKGHSGQLTSVQSTPFAIKTVCFSL